MIDLHVHTWFSDGQYSPVQVVRMAADGGISVLSITDHDTTEGISEAVAAAANMPLRLIPGIEISVKSNRELHLLGYFIDDRHPELVKLCDCFKRHREIRAGQIFEFLHHRGIPLTRAQVERYADHGFIGRPHFARAMVEAGYAHSMKEAFALHLSVPEFQQIERPKPEPERGIRVIRESGGVAVLAHPGHLGFDVKELESLLRQLIEMGLGGLECYYSTHTKQQTELYVSLAQKYGLVITGGSDFHGEKVKPHVQLGMTGNLDARFTDSQIEQKLQDACRN